MTGGDDREVLLPLVTRMLGLGLVDGCRHIDALAFWGTSIEACHREVDACFIHKEQVFGLESPYFGLIDAALLAHLLGIAFGRIPGLFFRVSRSVARVRCILDLLAVPCPRSSSKRHSSLRVASGYACTNAERLAYCAL